MVVVVLLLLLSLMLLSLLLMLMLLLLGSTMGHADVVSLLDAVVVVLWRTDRVQRAPCVNIFTCLT